MINAWIVAVAAILALTACSAPPATEPPAAAVTVRPLNSEPLVTSQSPARRFGGAGRNQVFQTPNSLPPGAATGPAR